MRRSRPSLVAVFHAQAFDLQAIIPRGEFFAKQRPLPAVTGSRTSSDSPFTDLSTCHVDKERSPTPAGTYDRFMIVTTAITPKVTLRRPSVSA